MKTFTVGSVGFALVVTLTACGSPPAATNVVTETVTATAESTEPTSENTGPGSSAVVEPADQWIVDACATLPYESVPLIEQYMNDPSNEFREMEAHQAMDALESWGYKAAVWLGASKMRAEEPLYAAAIYFRSWRLPDPTRDYSTSPQKVLRHYEEALVAQEECIAYGCEHGFLGGVQCGAP